MASGEKTNALDIYHIIITFKDLFMVFVRSYNGMTFYVYMFLVLRLFVPHLFLIFAIRLTLLFSTF